MFLAVLWQDTSLGAVYSFPAFIHLLLAASMHTFTACCIHAYIYCLLHPCIHLLAKRRTVMKVMKRRMMRMDVPWRIVLVSVLTWELEKEDTKVAEEFTWD